MTAIIICVALVVYSVLLFMYLDVCEKNAVNEEFFSDSTLAIICPVAYLNRQFPKQFNDLYVKHYIVICAFLFQLYFGIVFTNRVHFEIVVATVLFLSVIMILGLMGFMGNQTQKQLEAAEHELFTLQQEAELAEQQAEEAYEMATAEQKKLNALQREYIDILKQCHTEVETYNRCVSQISNKKKAFYEEINIVRTNLNLIESIDEKSEIAIDTNVLMMWDDYILEALLNRPIVISKIVQAELDKHKTNSDGQTAYLARRAMRRLLKSDFYRFVVSKWDSKFMQQFNLAEGVPDDEIIADYLTEKVNGKDLVVMSDDRNFLISAKVHFPILQLKNPRYFSD